MKVITLKHEKYIYIYFPTEGKIIDSGKIQT